MTKLKTQKSPRTMIKTSVPFQNINCKRRCEHKELSEGAELRIAHNEQRRKDLAFLRKDGGQKQ